MEQNIERKKVTPEEYKHILVDILEKIDHICEEYGLNYQLAYGTLLGAVRHGGFIPWDDDVDIVMPREDYIRLQELIYEKDYGINFLTIDTEPQTIYPYGKICATNTELDERNFRKVPGYGAFVDVFPLDYVPEDEATRKRIFKKYNAIIRLIQHSSRTGYIRTSSVITNTARCIAYHVGHCFSTRNLILKMDRSLQRLCPKEKTTMVSVPWDSEGNAFKIADIYCTKKVKFEGAMLNVPENYDDVLTKMYGDYMQLPPEDERVNPHSLECYYL